MNVPGFDHATIEAPGGVTLSVYTRNLDKPGPALIAIPGLGMTAWSWGTVAGQFEQPVAIVEPRGSGLSSGVKGEVTGADFVADVLAVLDEHGWDRAHIAGISMGGMIGQHLAIQAPERVASLIQITTYARPGPWGELAWKLRLGLVEFDDPMFQRYAAAMLLTSPESVEDRPGIVDMLLALWANAPNNTDSYRAQMRFCANHDVIEQLADVTVPTLVVSGANDILCTPAAGIELSDALNGSFRCVEGASHILANEKPDVLLSLMQDHLATTDGQNKAADLATA